jgi:hypothetical protein
LLLLLCARILLLLLLCARILLLLLLCARILLLLLLPSTVLTSHCQPAAVRSCLLTAHKQSTAVPPGIQCGQGTAVHAVCCCRSSIPEACRAQQPGLLGCALLLLCSS